MNKNDLPSSWIESQLRTAAWQTSSYSGGGSNCVQVAFLDGLVAVRDSKNPQDAPLLFTDAEYGAFVQGIVAGELRR